MITNKIDKYLEESTVPSGVRSVIKNALDGLGDSIVIVENMIKSYEKARLNDSTSDILKDALEDLKHAQKKLDKLV